MNKEYISVNLKSLTLQLKLFLSAQKLLKNLCMKKNYMHHYKISRI